MDKFVDLHNHSLPGFDDGAKDLEQTYENIDYLVSKGIKDIVLTTHYILNTKFVASVKERQQVFKKIKTALKTKKVNLYLGNEVYISDEIPSLLDSKEIMTIDNSRYLLIEFPLYQNVHQIDRLICELNGLGITPIIAHPERYHFLHQDRNRIRELLEYNCLLQCNLGSITGQYGRKAKSVMKWLLKEDLVSFIATDLHHVPLKDTFEKSIKKIRKLTSQEHLEELFYTNPKSVLENKLVELHHYSKAR